MTDTQAPASVLAIDDHALLREGIAAVVDGEAGLRYAGGAGTAHEGLALFRALRPDVTLLDILLPDRSGLDLMATLRAECPQARIIVLTTYRGDALASRALKAGALGYLLKSMLQSDLLAAIHAVHAGRRYVPAEIAIELSARLGEQDLSARELEVLRRVADGSSNKRIGADLGISEQTVKGHLKNILGKLAARDRTHAVTIALQRGFFSV
ncbi:response regulator [Rubrivivax gelatinosus]|uniref:response regulator n=1 Tax=Rubrivivax gelatinosus TaxID=28068 RepID=UPI001F5B66F7|nr:response regulator transcription factor [Rubrivivax gelatinosus]